jgi:hypothetical protein
VNMNRMTRILKSQEDKIAKELRNSGLHESAIKLVLQKKRREHLEKMNSNIPLEEVFAEEIEEAVQEVKRREDAKLEKERQKNPLWKWLNDA